MGFGKIKGFIMSMGSSLKSSLQFLYKQFNKEIKFQKVGAYETDIKKKLIVGTKSGLFIAEDNTIFKILDGRFYGITIFDNEIYTFERIGNRGRIIKFDKDFSPRDEYNIFINKLSPGCHQIDFIEDKLYITDTYNNRILLYNRYGEQLEEFYPIGKLANGRDSENYGHINSIVSQKDAIYLLCHNETKKTGKHSELLKLNKRFEVIEKIELDASSAHNCAFRAGNYLVCDSLNGRLITDAGEVFNCDYFTRGLALFDEFTVVGGSEYASREKRRQAKGALYILDNQYNEMEHIEMPGMVQEIRGLSDLDYSLSNIDYSI